jgi:two-component system, NarL family, sensor histidine kinase DesK
MSERVEEEAPASDEGLAGKTRTSRLPRGGRLLGPLFGMIFLIYPVRAVLISDPTLARISLALGGAALFAGVFLWTMWTQDPLWHTSAEPSELLRRRLTIVFLAALAISLNLVLGSEWRVLFFHVNIAAGVLLLTREAYIAIACLAIITVMLGALSGMAWIALPTAALGLWAIAFVRQLAAVAELRSAREELARMAVGEERLRFARDLHDLLGHSLSLITLKSELAGRLLPDEPEKAEAEVHDIEEVARQALGEVREAVAGYRSPTLDEELAGAAEMLGAAGIDFEIVNEAGLLPREMDGVLAWTVREGTTNVIRHSQARHCYIFLAREDGMVHAKITDDGRGEMDQGTSGSGLSGLAERVATFSDGVFKAGPLPEGGFRLRVELPLRREANR